MAADQSNRATGLLIPWDPDAPGPAHQRLSALLRAQVAQGLLRAGDRLPPSRALAEELGLSRWVVTEAYDQLKAEGYLSGRIGAGTVVSAGTSPTRPAPTPPSAGGAAYSGAAELDLSPALPDLASFPRALWRTAIGRALAHVSDAELGHPDPDGAPALRATMADYLRRVRGIDATAGQVHITQGVRSAVLLLSRVLREGGASRVAVEDPSWPRLREAVRAGGLEVVAVPVDSAGLRVDLLPDLAVDAVFTTPTHQFPTGVPLSAQRRGELITWARRRGGVVVEDDYDAEFRYDRRPVGALAALSGEHVVYLGSASKSLSPAVQLGWMVVPAQLSAALQRAKEVSGGLVPTLDQHALVHLIADGAYDRHLRRMRRRYQQRRSALVRALADLRVPGSTAQGMNAGLHVLHHLPPDLDEEAVRRACLARGMSVLGLGQCSAAGTVPGLVLGYGNVAEHRAPAVSAALAACIAAARASGEIASGEIASATVAPSALGLDDGHR